MRKESGILFATSIVLMLAIVGGTHYLYLQGRPATPEQETRELPFGVGNAQASRPAIRPAVRRTATPIKCTQPNGSVFWTNATRCEDADLDNRLSFAEPVNTGAKVKAKSSTFDVTQKAWEHTSQANSQILKQVPWKMKNECSYPIGKAQEIEKKSLRLKDDAAESVWKDSYCRWVCEARFEKCEDMEDYLGMMRLCPNRYYRDKKDCDT